MELINRANLHKFSAVRMVGEGRNEIIPVSRALEESEARGLDLVLVGSDTTPPVVRIQDVKKIAYERKKARKGASSSPSLKEVQFKVNISQHDLDTKLGRIQKFLDRGDKVKVIIRTKGRERENPERPRELLERVQEGLSCKVTRLPGPMAAAILEPLKGK